LGFGLRACLGFRIQALGLRIQALELRFGFTVFGFSVKGFRVWYSWFTIYNLVLNVMGSLVQNLGFGL
jgi:hypothetical protein